jgi:hypothetical protein
MDGSNGSSSRTDGSNGRKAKEWRSATWKVKEEFEEGRKDGEKKRTRGESEMAEMERKRNRLGEKLVGANNNQTDQIDCTYTLLSVMVKVEMEEKEAKEGETCHHCSHRMTIHSMTKMMHLPCTNQPS